MLVLGIHSGWQDAGAALFDEYRPLAEVPLSRVTGVAHDGGRLPVEAIAECLEIAGVTRRDIGGVAFSHGLFPSRYYTLPLTRRLGRRLRTIIGRVKHTNLAEECLRHGREAAEAMIDTETLLGELGLGRHLPVRFYSRHTAYGLLPLFQTDWQEALLFTADAGGDAVACDARILRYGRLASFFGEDDAAPKDGGEPIGRLIALAIEGLGLPDMAALVALSAYGEPMLAQALLAHIHIDGEGRIRTDFEKEGGAAKWLRRLAEGHSPAVVAASLQKMLEDVFGEAIGRLMERHGLRNLVLGGGLFANPRLLHSLIERLNPDGFAVHPDAGDLSLPLGGVLHFLQARDGMEEWLRQRRPFPDPPSGRDYGADIDPVLGNAGCRLVSQDAVQAAAALLNAGKVVALYGRQAFGLRDHAERSVLFTAGEAGMAGAVNAQLDRPEMMPPVLYLQRQRASDLLETPFSAAAPARIAEPLAKIWRGRLPAAMAPDFLCLPHAADPDQEPLLAAILDAYAELSGLPAIMGLPLQIGAGVPIDTPADALRLLQEGRVDYIATEQAVWERGE